MAQMFVNNLIIGMTSKDQNGLKFHTSYYAIKYQISIYVQNMHFIIG